MKKKQNIIINTLVMFLAILTLFTQSVEAETPYKTYTIDGEGKYTETQSAYLPLDRFTKFNDLQLSQPEDMVLGDDGLLYVADTGNARILVLKTNSELVKVIGEDVLIKPVGLDINKNGKIYVADEGLAQVVEFDFEGNVLHIFDRPEHPLFGKKAPFTPIKVTSDSRENIYVLSRGNNNGLIQLNRNTEDEFLGYFAPNLTSVSFMTSFRRLIFTDEQISKMLDITPNSPVNITMDDEGLIYTVTPQDGRNTLKKLNMAGKNIIASRLRDIRSVDVSVGPHQNIFVAASNGYIYEYTRDGNLLFVFGGQDSGQQRLGLFSNVSAIEVSDNNEIYVLDQNKGEIQSFKTTEFSDTVHEALVLYQSGNYTESKEPWTEVLKINSLFDFANLGMGEAYFKEENYTQALDSYRLARDIDGYSDAFWEVRNVWIRENVIQGLGILTGIYLLIQAMKQIRKRSKMFKPIDKVMKRVKANKLYQEVMYLFYYMKHPIDGAYGIRWENKTSNLSTGIIAGLAVTILIINKYLTGFIFRSVSEGQFTLVWDILSVIIVFVFVTIATYLVCTISDGESKLRQLFHGFVYSFGPYILIKPFLVLISNVLTLNEGFLIVFTNLIILAWVLTLLFVSLKELNNYEYRETIKIILLSVFTIFIGVLIGFVLYILVSQLFNFIQSVFGEVVYRFEKR